MAQVGVASRPNTGMSTSSKKLLLPQIEHPLSRMSNPENLGIRGTSRGGDRALSRSQSLMGNIRPLASERAYPVRRSISQAGGRHSVLSQSAPIHPLRADAIPEGIEVKHGDPCTTRLPIFGKCSFDCFIASSRAGIGTRDGGMESRMSSRLSMVSQARLEIDELEVMLKEKVHSGFFEIRNRFKMNDPEQKGNVTREALARILVSVLARAISQSQFNRLMDRIGLKEKQMVSYTEFFSCFREPGDGEIPQWMDPVQRHFQEKVNMSAQQVHMHLKEKAKMNMLGVGEVIDTTGNLLKPEFRNMLLKDNLPMDDEEFDKLWAKYDTHGTGCIKGETLLKKLGAGKKKEAAAQKPKPAQETTASECGDDKRTPRRLELERQQSINVENWLKNKFREGFSGMKETFQKRDPENTGMVSHDVFLEVLAEYGLKLDRPYIYTFMARCCVELRPQGVPYKDFLYRFLDRSEAGMAHNILSNPKHRYNERGRSATNKSTVSAIETQLMNLFQRDFLKLLGTFHQIDKFGTDVITQEEFRAAIESKFDLEMTDDEFRSFVDKVPLTDDGLVKYGDFMSLFDTKGQAPSLFDAKSHKIPLAESDDGGSDVIEAEDQLVMEAEPTNVIHRSTPELFKLIREVIKNNYQEVERKFHELDEMNTGQFTQEMMYQLFRKFDMAQEITRGEIRDIWKTFIVNRNKTLNFYEFVRHFGWTLRSAAFPNAKVCPPRRGDADCMMRSRKLNGVSDMLQDNVRAKVDYLWEDLRQEFVAMDPYVTNNVTREEFQDVLTELNIHLSDYELQLISKKFDMKRDGRINYVEFLKPFALKRQVWRHGNNMLSLLAHPQSELPIPDIVEPPQKGLHGVTAKLRQKMAGDWKNLRRAFKKLDASNLGYLSLPEFRSVLKLANVVLDEDEVYHVMTRFDENMTGNIAYQQFLDETFKVPPSRASNSRKV
ncbi:EF-hand calcium-binding domain-containing protein 6-like [Tubulanus polymorphus]|uniref:EF-hand calcium-binding domain-containing protein 6-like n=1 Tax=Tubulanus polymorphus TaxID=672921 RepID=UPI003DA4CD75